MGFTVDLEQEDHRSYCASVLGHWQGWKVSVTEAELRMTGLTDVNRYE